jgi:cytochrome c553
MKKLLLIALAALPLMAGAQTAAKPTTSPQTKAALCIGCHGIPGYQASFPEIHKVPMIAGQGAKYITSALNQYKKGDRKHPTMRAITASLSEQDMVDLGVFYAAQAGGEPAPAVLNIAPSAEVAELLKKGNCISCHGANFSAPIDATYPKLAGQHADYLYVALKAYKTEGNPQVGRNNAIMGGMVKPYSPAELKLIANYVASLPSELKTVPQSRWR